MIRVNEISDRLGKIFTREATFNFTQNFMKTQNPNYISLQLNRPCFVIISKNFFAKNKLQDGTTK